MERLKGRIELRLRNLLESGLANLVFLCQDVNRTLNFQLYNEIQLALNIPATIQRFNYMLYRSHDPFPMIKPFYFADVEELNQHPLFNSKYQILRLYSFFSRFSMTGNLDFLERYLAEPNDEEQNQLTDERNARFLAKRFEISDSSFGQIALSLYDSWKRTVLEESIITDSKIPYTPFLDSDGTFRFALEVRQDMNEQRYIVLPIAAYVKPGFSPLLVNDWPTDRLVCLNSDQLQRYPKAKVFLTDELAIALFNPSSPEQVFLYIFDEDEALSHTDFSPLQGRRITYLLFDRPGEKKGACWGKSMRLSEYLYQQGIELDFIYYEIEAWECQKGTFHSSCRQKTQYNFFEYVKEIKRLKLFLPEMFMLARFNNKSLDDLDNEPARDCLIGNLLWASSYIVLFGGSGLGKTWISLALAIALADGKNLFSSGRWKMQCPEGVKILYVLGEMDNGEIKERLEVLVQQIKTHRNFVYNRVNGLHLETPEGQKELLAMIDNARKFQEPCGKPVKVLFLDSLITLTESCDSPARFHDLFRFIERLKSMGIGIVLNHHEKADGTMRGTSDIINYADMVQHLYKGESTRDQLAILVGNDKPRSVAAEDVKPFKILIHMQTGKLSDGELSMDELEGLQGRKNANKDCQEKSGRVSWEFLPNRQRLLLVVQQILEGKNNQQIADGVGISERKIEKFRLEKHICDTDLRILMEAVDQTCSKEYGNCITTSEQISECLVRNLLKREKN